MPIDFPNNPSAGQTYSYGINRWIYNGVAWDKIDNHPGICGGNQILINYAEGFNGATFQVNVIEGKGSDLDSDLIHGVSGSRFLEHLQSGLLYGATLAVNAGNTAYFDLSAGAGIIVNFGATLSNYPNPTVSLVTWPSRTGLTAQYIATHHETWLSIDSSGNIIQQETKWSDQQYESRIPIGVLIHPNHTTINLAVDIPKLSYGNATQVDPFMRAFGPLKLSGHEISANGANLRVNKSSGTAFLLGRNYTTDPNYANVVTDTNATPISTIYHYYRDVSGDFISTTSAFIDPTKYDDGSGTLATAPSGKYTTQRLFFLPGTPTVLAAYYGREIYNSIETAQANIQFESFSEDDSTASLGVFGGYLIVKANTTALNNSADAKFISSGIFRNLSNIGGGGVAVAGLDDLTDVVITSASNNQVLKYESGFWINSGLTSSIGNYVTTFNGLTGAVTGVTTSVANTFTALQTFNAGLSATGITLDGTLEINKRPITFVGSSVNLLNGVPGLVLQGATTGYASRIVINSNEKDGTTASIDLIPFNGNVYIRKGEYEDGGVQAMGDWKSSLYLEENQLFGGIHYGILTVPGNLSADRTLTFPNDSGTIALTKNVVSSVNGSTGAIQVVSSFNGRTGAVQGVSAAFGGTGISVSGSTGSITISNTGVLSFNGLTGAVTGVTTSVANIFEPLQSFTNGISSAGGTFGNLTRFNAGLSASFVRTPSIQGSGGGDVIFDSGSIKLLQLGFPSNNTTRLTASSTVDQTITLPDDTGTVALTKNVVSSFNGLTGAIIGVNSVRGLTGAVGITNGSGIGLSVSGQTMTFSNTGVLSIDGGTGAITNVARTNVDNIFSASQTISTANAALAIVDSSSLNEVSFQGEFNRLYFYNDISSGEVYLQPTIATASTITVSLPNYTTTLAGLAGTQTFTGTNTFNTLTNFPGGISAAGATFSSLARFNAGISAAGATFSGNISAPNIVNSVRGLTGAVGITNGSGIGLSVSGQTMTFSNTGVLSFNGLTGAVTGVTTGSSNTFGPVQSFTNGISAAGSTFASVATNYLRSSDLLPAYPLYINDIGGSQSFIGDYSNNNLSTYFVVNDDNGDIVLSAPAAGIQFYSAPTSSLLIDSQANFANLPIVGTTASFSGLLTSSGGLSASGATFSSLARFNAGISAAGAKTFNSNVTINSANTLIASTIQSAGGKNQLDIANTSNSRVAIGDYDAAANSTYLFLRDATSILDISNPYGLINIGDPFGIDTGAYISYEAAAGELNGNGSSIANFGFASFTNTVSVGGLLTASAGISAAGATLSSLTTIPSGATLSVRGNITGNVVNSINGITGAVNLAAGSNITITPSGLTLTIAAGAGFSRSINVITTSTTAGATSNVDYVYIGNTSGNINLTLPTAVSNANRYTVKNSNIGILTVLTTSSQTIDGVTGYSLSKQFQAIDLLSDNSNWVVV
jgi:hypothetical protein